MDYGMKNEILRPPTCRRPTRNRPRGNMTIHKTLWAAAVVIALASAPSCAGVDESAAAKSRGDYATALAEFKAAADQGDAVAQYNLGLMYYNGQGVPRDDQLAAAWFRKAADQGHAVAQYNLGLMYAIGQGVPQDYKQAAAWYRKAADQGDAAAQSSLGDMYWGGEGVPQDYRQAVAWFRKAADQEWAAAQLILGLMYENGEGVPKSKIVAYALYNLSATNDPSRYNTAIEYREGIIKEMTPQEIQAAQDLTRELSKPGNFGSALDSAPRGLKK